MHIIIKKESLCTITKIIFEIKYLIDQGGKDTEVRNEHTAY